MDWSRGLRDTGCELRVAVFVLCVAGYVVRSAGLEGRGQSAQELMRDAGYELRVVGLIK